MTVDEADSNDNTTDVEHVLRALDVPHGELPVEAIRSAQRLKTEIIPGLISKIRRATRDAREEHEPETNGHFFALFLLIEFRAGEAWPSILEAVTLPGDWPGRLFGDAIHEALPQTVVTMAHDRIDEVAELIRNREVDEYVRWAMANGLVYCVIAGSHSRDEIVGLLRDALRGCVEQRDSDGAMGLVNALIDIYPEEAYEDIKQAFDQGLTFDGTVNMQDVDRQMKFGQEATLRELAEHSRPIKDTVAFLHTWAGFATRESRPSLMPSGTASPFFPSPPLPATSRSASQAENSQPKIGRNAPCPCGSGKKFKKCCLNRGR